MTASDFQSASDEDLARQTQAGSMAAFEALVYRYEGRIYGFVAYSSRNWMDAREITQDTFVKAFQSIGQYDARYPLAAWLFTIARRNCIDHYRRRPPWTQEPVPEMADLDDPARLLEQQDQQQQLWQVARRCLPEAQFQALWLKYAEDMDVAQVARVLGKTQTHVKVLLFRARQRLCRELEQAGPPPAPAGSTSSTLNSQPSTLNPSVAPAAWPLLGQKDPL